MSTLDALIEAQRWMLTEAAPRGLKPVDGHPSGPTGQLPPYYWASFVLSGDWR